MNPHVSDVYNSRPSLADRHVKQCPRMVITQAHADIGFTYVVLTNIGGYRRGLAWRTDVWAFSGSGADTANAANDRYNQLGSRRAPVTQAEGCSEAFGCCPEFGRHVSLMLPPSISVLMFPLDVSCNSHCLVGIQLMLPTWNCNLLLIHSNLRLSSINFDAWDTDVCCGVMKRNKCSALCTRTSHY